MNKIFLYLYPIKEYYLPFEFPEEYLLEIGRENPYKILNECIQKRYREKGYKVFMLFIQIKIFMELIFYLLIK